MIAYQEKREAEKAKAKAGGDDSDASSAFSSHVGSESEEEDKEAQEDPDLIAAALAERKAMVWEPLPSADGPETDTGGGDWERAGVAERLSAAGAVAQLRMRFSKVALRPCSAVWLG